MSALKIKYGKLCLQQYMLECLKSSCKKRTESVIPFEGRGGLLKKFNCRLKCLWFP